MLKGCILTGSMAESTEKSDIDIFYLSKTYQSVYNIRMEKNSESIILNKATELFSAKGYDGVGVQEICTESKITKPTSRREQLLP